MPLAGISDPFLKYQVKPDTELDVCSFKSFQQTKASFECRLNLNLILKDK